MRRVFFFFISSSTYMSLLRLSVSSTCRHPPPPSWTHVSVEWSPAVATVCDSLESVAPHFVLPDLPPRSSVLLQEEQYRTVFYQSTRPEQRILTVAVCHYPKTSWQSLVTNAKTRLGLLTDRLSTTTTTTTTSSTKLLIVGGNDKKKKDDQDRMTTEEAVTILRSELDDVTTTATTIELWAVADPNDPDSPQRVETKLQAGIHGIITQPLLTSTAWETLPSYPPTTRIVVGMACPKTVHHLHFWQTLLTHPDRVGQDPLFQSHVDYISRLHDRTSTSSSLTWIEHELQQLLSTRTPHVTGVHFMPWRNVEDLVTLFGSLKR